MKTSSQKAKLITTAIGLLMVAVILASSGAGLVTAASGGIWKTGMFSLASGQTARINAVCLPPGPCHVQMIFLDNMGNVVGRFEHDQELRSGQAAFFDTTFEVPMKERVQLRAVGMIGNDGDRPKGESALFTAEVFDNETGKATFTPTFQQCIRCLAE